MNQQEIEEFISSLENVEREENLGYIFFFVGDYHMTPFATIAQSDNEHDNVSQLDREGVFRLNIGVNPETFKSLFGDTNPEQKWDYAALDTFMPYPEYAAYSFICILNPSEQHAQQVKSFLVEAHEIAQKRYKAIKG